MQNPLSVCARDVHDLTGVLNRMTLPIDSKRFSVPIVMTVDEPTELCIFSQGAQNPFKTLDQAARWVQDAVAPLEMIATGLVKEKVPQQLLTVRQSVALTFMLNHDAIDMLVTYSCRDIHEAVLSTDFVAFSLGLQLLSKMADIPVGRVYITVAQAVIDENHTSVDQNPYTYDMVSPIKLSDDYKTLISDLSLFLEDGPVVGITDRFVKKVLGPMWVAGRELEDGEFDLARTAANSCRALDWKMAALNYIDDMETSNAVG